MIDQSSYLNKINVNGAEYKDLPDNLYIPPSALRVVLEQFEGPLDLLLYFIRRDELDIYDKKEYDIYCTSLHSVLERLQSKKININKRVKNGYLYKYFPKFKMIINQEKWEKEIREKKYILDKNNIQSIVEPSNVDEDIIKLKSRGKLVLDSNSNIMYCSRNIIPSNKNNNIVDILFDDFDKYGRPLGIIYKNNININDILIIEGYAKKYDGGTKEKW